MGWNLRYRSSYIFISEDLNLIESIINDLDDQNVRYSKNVLVGSEMTPNTYYTPLKAILNNLTNSYGPSDIATGEKDLLQINKSKYKAYVKLLNGFFNEEFKEKHESGRYITWISGKAGTYKFLKYIYFGELKQKLKYYLENYHHTSQYCNAILKLTTDLDDLQAVLESVNEIENYYQTLNVQKIEHQINKVVSYNDLKEQNSAEYEFVTDLFSNNNISFEFYYFNFYRDELDIINFTEQLQSITSFDNWLKDNLTSASDSHIGLFDSPFMDPDYPS